MAAKLPLTMLVAKIKMIVDNITLEDWIEFQKTGFSLLR